MEGLSEQPFYSRGDKSKGGNPNLRVVLKDGVSFLEVSTLEKTIKNRAIKVLMSILFTAKTLEKDRQSQWCPLPNVVYRFVETRGCLPSGVNQERWQVLRPHYV